MKGRFAALLCGLFFAPLVSAQPTPTSATSTAPTLSEQWRFSVTPYAWAMGIRGSVSHNGTSLGTVKLTSGDILSDIKMPLCIPPRSPPQG